MDKPIKKLLFILIALALVAALVVVMLYNGILWFNNPARWRYPVRGVDVSSYQGAIDWPVLAAQGIDFAFIKATEGSGLVDNRFAYNWRQANRTGLLVGAYHFLSYDSAAATQAQNFIDTVPVTPGMLPPVIDVEFYGGYYNDPPPKELVQPLLDELLALLEAHYGLKPILYVTTTSYGLYIQGGYDEHLIWARSMVGQPQLDDGRAWDFWQYSNRGRLDGYDGDERFIDLNVYNGSRQELEGHCL